MSYELLDAAPGEQLDGLELFLCDTDERPVAEGVRLRMGCTWADPQEFTAAAGDDGLVTLPSMQVGSLRGLVKEYGLTGCCPF